MALATDPGLGETQEEVVTIRVINVPTHTSQTEFNCWFLFAPGFEQATLVPTRGPAQSQLGWARFSTVETAQAAVQFLNGRQLTEDQSPEGITLAADFARSNYRPSSFSRKRAFSDVPPRMAAQPAIQPAIQVHVPAPQAAPPAPPAAGSVRYNNPRCSTLFLGGLPMGAQEHELLIFFQGSCHGFERLKFVTPVEGRPGMGFAKFAAPDYAEAALQTIAAGVTLPSCPGFSLQAEYARNDLDMPSRGRMEAEPSGHGLLGTAFSPLGASQHALPQQTFVPQQTAMHVPPPVHRAADGTAPCDTMFVGNLPATVTEHELTSVFMTLPGYLRTKVVGIGQPRPVAFVLFDSIENCAQSIQALVGTALPSAPTQGMTCEYSKNSLDKRQRTM